MKNYFTFDEVIHFNTDGDAMQFLVIEGLPKWSDDDILLKDIIIGSCPKSLDDTAFIKKLIPLGFKKKIT